MKTALIAAPMAAPFALACPASARPSPMAAAQIVRLGDGFTLIYQATARDPRPAFLREKQTAEAKKATSEALAAVRMQKSMADDYATQDAGLARPRPTEIHSATTLSAYDRRFSHLSSRGTNDREVGTEAAILLDGDIEH